MKKIVLALALAGFLAAGTATPALACEGGKCTMDHAAQTSKTKKGKKAAAKAESCHMMPAAGSEASASMAGKSCCAKKEAPKKEVSKEVKAQR